MCAQKITAIVLAALCSACSLSPKVIQGCPKFPEPPAEMMIPPQPKFEDLPTLLEEISRRVQPMTNDSSPVRGSSENYALKDR